MQEKDRIARKGAMLLDGGAMLPDGYITSIGPKFVSNSIDISSIDVSGNSVNYLVLRNNGDKTDI